LVLLSFIDDRVECADFWGAPVAGVTRPTVDGRDASPMSAIEASSAVAVAKLDGSD
jgi:hypothetical protein